MTDSTEQTPTRSRRQIWILIGIFFAPLLLAFLLYYGVSGWRPAGSTNHGELITPPRPLPEVPLTATSGAKLDSSILRGKWTLVYVGDGACDEQCRQSLTLLRQTRLALNDDLTRVQRLFLVTANCCDHEYLNGQHVGLISAKADDSAGRQVLNAFPDGARAGQLGRIYIIDPLGNLMMYYAPLEQTAAAKRGLLEDMKKLLKLSHIG
jgi:hypothetical protein